MCINSQGRQQSEQNKTISQIQRLRKMLILNKNAQKMLGDIKSANDKRLKQLQQLGVIEDHLLINFEDRTNRIAAIEQSRKIPQLLLQQQLIKKSSVNDYGFIKNLTQQKQDKTKKKKQIPPQAINYSQLSSKANSIDFVQLAKRQKQKTGIQIYKQWKKQNKKKRQLLVEADQKKQVNVNQQRLLEKRKIYGDNWQKIGYYFNGLTFQDLYYYYQKNLNKVQTGKWTLRQNLILIALVQYYGSGKWALISKKLKIKSQFQIRQRFCNVLNPNIKQNNWSEQDEQLLLKQAKLKNYKWSTIVRQVKQFSNKTDNALRRKFRNIMIKKQDDQIKSMIKNKSLQESILKFKKNYYNRSKKANKNQENAQGKMEQQQQQIPQMILSGAKF